MFADFPYLLTCFEITILIPLNHHSNPKMLPVTAGLEQGAEEADTHMQHICWQFTQVTHILLFSRLQQQQQ